MACGGRAIPHRYAPVGALASDVDAPLVALAQRLRDQIIMPPGRAETFNHGRDGGLLRREEVCVTAQVLCSDAAGEVTLNSGDGGPGVEPP